MSGLRERARALGLHGLLERWDEISETGWIEEVVAGEERARMARSHERRRAEARLPAFKPMADFDWAWPRDIERGDVEALMELGFVGRADNAVLVGGTQDGFMMHTSLRCCFLAILVPGCHGGAWWSRS